MKKLTVTQTAQKFKVSRMAVYYWIQNGLKTEKVKVIGKKEYQVIDPDDVVKFLGLTEKVT